VGGSASSQQQANDGFFGLKVSAADLPQIPQSIADAVTGFGDGAFKVVTVGFGNLQSVRDSIGIDGGINRDSAAYKGFEVAGGVVGGGAVGGVGFRLLSNFTGTARSGFLHWLNHNQYFRIGPGRMPGNGGLPSGTSVPRIRIGTGSPSNSNHIDIRIRPFD